MVLYVILMFLHAVDVYQATQVAATQEANALMRALWLQSSLLVPALLKGLSVAALFLVDEWLRRRVPRLLWGWRIGVYLHIAALMLILVFNAVLCS
jgi:hypothetical protein